MGQNFVDLIPTYLCLIVGAFLFGNTRLIRFVRPLIPPSAVLLLCYRAFSHFLAYSKNDLGRVSFFDMLITGYNILLQRCNNKAVGALLGDVIGILIVGLLLNILHNLMFLKFSAVKKEFLDSAYGIVRHVPQVKSLLIKEQTKIEESFEKDLKVKSRAIGTKYPTEKNLPNSYSALPAKVTFCLFAYLFICSIFYFIVCLFNCLIVLYVCLFFCLFNCLHVCLSVCLSFCPSVMIANNYTY